MDEQKNLTKEALNNGRDSKYLLAFILCCIVFFVFYGVAASQVPNIFAAIIAGTFCFAAAQWVLTRNNVRFISKRHFNKKDQPSHDIANGIGDLSDITNVHDAGSIFYRDR